MEDFAKRPALGKRRPHSAKLVETRFARCGDCGIAQKPDFQELGIVEGVPAAVTPPCEMLRVDFGMLADLAGSCWKGKGYETSFGTGC